MKDTLNMKISENLSFKMNTQVQQTLVKVKTEDNFQNYNKGIQGKIQSDSRGDGQQSR